MNSRNISNEVKTKQMKSIGALENLKSNYIFKRILICLVKKKSLEIIKYNKKLQKIVNLSINDYKIYSELYSSIEIELKPVENKYGKLINISDKDKDFYHIYFDDSNEEKKRNYLNENEKVKIIKIIINYQVISFKDLFYNCDYISSINFKIFNRINITDMSDMFSICSSLEELNLSNFNTKNVTNMSNMFYICSKIKELNLSNFNTNNVTNMSFMFCGCSSLKELYINNFNTDKVTDMRGMFINCSSLKELNLSNFIINNGTVISEMFISCSSLKELNLPYFNDDKIFCNCRGIFFGCSNELKNKVKIQNKKLMI